VEGREIGGHRVFRLRDRGLLFTHVWGPLWAVVTIVVVPVLKSSRRPGD
jgi:hypothetical protein